MFIIDDWIRIEYYSAIERRKSCQLQQHRWTWGQYPKWNRQRHYYMISLIVKEKVLVTQSCMTLCNPMDWLYPSRLLCPWNSPDKNTGMGSHSLLQGIFPIQGLSLGLLHCQQILYCLSHHRSPSHHIHFKICSLAFTIIFTRCKMVTINTQIVNNSSALIRSVFPSVITPPVWKTSYNIFGNASLLVMNSFSFCVSLRSSQYSLLWKGVFTRYRILGWR